MNRTFPKTLAKFVCACLLVSPVAYAVDPPPIADGVCSGCHGIAGVSLNPLVPTLAGQPFTLIEDNLLAFRAGKRACAPARADGSPAAILAASMCGTVRQLPDDEISALAAYYSGLEFVPAEQTFDREMAARGASIHEANGCNRCHAAGGQLTLGIAPVLSGQWSPHLRRALEAIRAGTRRGPKMMNGPIRDLEDSAIESLVHFYASRQGWARE